MKYRLTAADVFEPPGGAEFINPNKSNARRSWEKKKRRVAIFFFSQLTHVINRAHNNYFHCHIRHRCKNKTSLILRSREAADTGRVSGRGGGWGLGGNHHPSILPSVSPHYPSIPPPFLLSSPFSSLVTWINPSSPFAL